MFHNDREPSQLLPQLPDIQSRGGRTIIIAASAMGLSWAHQHVVPTSRWLYHTVAVLTVSQGPRHLGGHTNQLLSSVSQGRRHLRGDAT